MNRFRTPLALILVLILLLSPVLSGCSLVSVVEETDGGDGTESDATASTKAKTTSTTTAKATTSTTAATTAEPKPETDPVPPLGTHLKTAPESPYTATPCTPRSDKYTSKVLQKALSTSGAKMVAMSSREGVEYPRRLPISLDLGYAADRGELVRIVNWHAFYRESGFSVTLGYDATDVEEELNYLWRHSDLLASQCALYGSLADGVITVDLVFHPENYLAYPRYTTPAVYLGGETSAPKGTDTLPGLDPEHGVSVWDSEQACYALANGYKISPIPGSPAESIVETAKNILSGMIDDGMTEWQIAYRVYVWLMSHAAYDQAEHWAGNIDTADRAKLSEALSSQLISFKAEGPLLYGVGACFGFAKASVLLLGLEGIELRRVVAFSTRLPSGRCCILAPPSTSIAIHSYLYLRIGGYDYIYDPTFVGENKQTIAGVDVSVFRDFAIGMSFDEHRTIFGAYYKDKDFYAETDAYNPGSYYYLSELTYDGSHSLLLSNQAAARYYYDYLLETVFSKPAEYRTVTLFYGNVSLSDWNRVHKSYLLDFLARTGVPCSTPNPQVTTRQGINGVSVILVFGK